MIKYIAIDPGETCGVALYNEKCVLEFMQCISNKKLKEFLWKLKDIEICICEDYIVYQHKAEAHTGSRLATARVIGKIEIWAELFEIKLIKQPAHNYDLGLRFLGMKKPPRSDPLSHAKIAHAHFTFWGVKTGRIDPKGLIKR